MKKINKIAAFVILLGVIAIVWRAPKFLMRGMYPDAFDRALENPEDFLQYIWNYSAGSQSHLSPSRLRWALSNWFRPEDYSSDTI